MRIVTILFLSLCLLLGIEGYGFYYTPIAQTPTELYVPKGSSIRAVANQLQLTSPKTFIFMARLRHAGHVLRAGEYELPAGTTPNQLLQQLVAGKIRMREIKIIEGWQFRQVLTALHQNPYLQHDLLGKTGAEITAHFGNGVDSLEGNLFPDTYMFARGTSETEIVNKARKLMHKQLTKAWNQRAHNLPYKSSLDALIVASLIEKETAINAERPQIAGVILRRLHNNMLLQIDPTVIYALGESYTGKLHKEDMSIESKFNTYKSKGLPPTPIAMPGFASIEAAVHPATGTALYYVARGDGSHEFTDNLKDHQVAIQKFLKSKGNS